MTGLRALAIDMDFRTVDHPAPPELLLLLAPLFDAGRESVPQFGGTCTLNDNVFLRLGQRGTLCTENWSFCHELC